MLAVFSEQLTRRQNVTQPKVKVESSLRRNPKIPKIKTVADRTLRNITKILRSTICDDIVVGQESRPPMNMKKAQRRE